MLTCFESPTNTAFQKILKFFVKKESIILDITYGRGLSWKNIEEDYKLIKVDKRKFFNDVIKANLNDFLKEKEDSSVDCIFFDPPYYFKEKIQRYNLQKGLLFNENEIFWTEDEFDKSLDNIKKEVPRILKNDGIFIIKIMDGYIGKKHYPNAFILFNALNKIMESKGIFICPIKREDNDYFVRENHIYYIIFKKEKY